MKKSVVAVLTLVFALALAVSNPLMAEARTSYVVKTQKQLDSIIRKKQYSVITVKRKKTRLAVKNGRYKSLKINNKSKALILVIKKGAEDVSVYNNKDGAKMIIKVDGGL